MRDFTFPPYPSRPHVVQRATEVANDAGINPDIGYGPDSLGWSVLRQDPIHAGLAGESETKILIEFVTRSATAMVGQVLACDHAKGADGHAHAEVNHRLWVDILLRQIPQQTSNGLSTFEFSAQALTEQGLEVRKTARSVLMPVELQARFLLIMAFQRGYLRLGLHSADRREQLSCLEIDHFGGCTPVLRLRSGRQPFSSSVVRANYELVA